MEIKTFNFQKTLNKISLFQAGVLCIIGILFFFQNKLNIFTGILISGITSSVYTQLIKFSSYSKFFALFGYPLRILIVGVPCAILVHKLHSDLIALFSGFVLCQLIYIFIISLDTKGN